MKKVTMWISAVIVALLIIVAANGFFVVTEMEQAVITQFGKPVGNTIVTPGVHYKLPFIQNANFFDKRFLAWDGSPNQVPTKDKRFIWVDMYARWRVSDALLFYQRVHDERGAQSRLDDILDGETRNAIAKHDLVELIRTSNRKSLLDEEAGDGDDTLGLAKIEYGREQTTRAILEVAAPRIRELGIELLDLRFKRINYIDEVQAKIFEWMISERKRIAEKFRSEGEGEASKILGDKERELKSIQSEAYRTAQEIIGKADSEATVIYAQAYNRTAETRDFYRFIKTMETYKNTLTEKDLLILSTKSDFFEYLQNLDGK
jgi:membrane protease subunit HflC